MTAFSTDHYGRNWNRVSVHEHCPIYDHADWCRIFDDGGIECMRVESPVQCASGGWMHWPSGHPSTDWRDQFDRHVSNQPTDDVDRLLRALRTAAVNGEFLAEIGGIR